MTAIEIVWAERDRRYATRRYGGVMVALSDNEVKAIKHWRRREIDELPPDERSIAWGRLQNWVPPLSGRR